VARADTGTVVTVKVFVEKEQIAPVRTEQALFQNRSAAIPQRQRETQELPVVGDAAQSIFTSTISA
jgi:hypothetical protein